MQPISIVIKHAVSKIGAAISSAYGKVLAIALCLCEYFAEHKFVVFLVVATTFMDAIWGISVSIKEKKFTLSELLRNTIGKLAVYGCALFVFVGLDKFIDSTVTAKVIGGAICLVELWSSSASMLILFPDFPFLKLMYKSLTGEIASKLGIPEDEVMEVLHNKRKSHEEESN